MTNKIDTVGAAAAALMRAARDAVADGCDNGSTEHAHAATVAALAALARAARPSDLVLRTRYTEGAPSAVTLPHGETVPIPPGVRVFVEGMTPPGVVPLYGERPLWSVPVEATAPDVRLDALSDAAADSVEHAAADLADSLFADLVCLCALADGDLPLDAPLGLGLNLIAVPVYTHATA